MCFLTTECVLQTHYDDATLGSNPRFVPLDWTSFVTLRDDAEVRAKMAKFSGIFVQELQRQKSMARPRQHAIVSTGAQQRRKVRGFNEEATSMISPRDRNEKIQVLISQGQQLMRKGVFALPRLSWRRDESALPEEIRVLDMIGFLLDAYDKRVWWWEVFEMIRKLMLAGAIILVPTEGGKQIGFAVLISTISLYVSLRTCPYIRENLLKLHVMSLTAQSLTLFYALLLEVQDLATETLDCSGGTCKRKISDVIMDYLLTLLQVSVLLLPLILLLRDRGCFDAVVNAFRRTFSLSSDSSKQLWATPLDPRTSTASPPSKNMSSECRKSSQVSSIHAERQDGTTVAFSKREPLQFVNSITAMELGASGPSVPTKEECGSSSPVRSQKKGRNQAHGTIYSSRELRTACGVTPQDVRQLRTTDDIQPIEVECSTQAEEIPEPRPQRTAAVLPTAEVQSSKQVLLSTMLSRFDLQDDVEDLAKSGIRKLSDLAYLDQTFIKNLPDLTPLCKRKLEKLIASCTSAKSGLSGDDWSHEEGEAVRLFSHIPFSRRFSPEPNSVVQNFIGLNRDVEGSAVVAPGDLRPVTASNDISAFADALCGNGCFGADAQVSHWSCILACMLVYLLARMHAYMNTYIHMHIRTFIHMDVCTSGHVHVCTHAYARTHEYLYAGATCTYSRMLRTCPQVSRM